jgi:hypothetical protein
MEPSGWPVGTARSNISQASMKASRCPPERLVHLDQRTVQEPETLRGLYRHEQREGDVLLHHAPAVPESPIFHDGPKNLNNTPARIPQHGDEHIFLVLEMAENAA